jgi:HK97 family phage portal protein
MNPLLQWLGGAFARPPLAAPAELKSVFALHGLGEANWTELAGPALAREGYQRNPVVYRCVRMVAEALSSLPFVLREGEAEIVAHPLLDLLAKPSPGRSGAAFLDTLTSHLLVSGNAYVHAAAIDNAPRELHLLRPDRVRVVCDRDGWPQAYEYGEGERKRRFDIDGDPAPVLHLAMHSPLDDVAGMPPLQAARMALDIHNSACRWNKALLDNSARPSGALVYAAPEAGNLTEEQFSRLKRELEEGYSGPSRAGRPMVLEGGLDWRAMGYSPRDMDFIEAKNAAARDIALAFGVPPMLLGIPGDLTYANYQEANRALWRNTVLPLSARIATALGSWLADYFGDELRLDFDRDGIEALAADREALWRRLIAADFLTADEKRAAAGYDALGEGAAELPGQDRASPPEPPQGGAPIRKFRVNQPRVPAGDPDGGQWTDDGGALL